VICEFKIAYTLVIAVIGSIMAQSKGIGEFRGENYAIHTALTKLDNMIQQTKDAFKENKTDQDLENYLNTKVESNHVCDFV
jgi:hypothetical protein